MSKLTFLLCVLLLKFCFARKHGYEKSKSNHADKVKLTVASEPRSGQSPSAPAAVHIVDVEVELLMSAVEWRELMLDGITMESCQSVPESRRTKVDIKGENVDMSDFATSPISFIITQLEWNDVCGKSIGSFPDIPNEEELLCFSILNTVGKTGESAMLFLERINCASVASSVTATVRNQAVPGSSRQDRVLHVGSRVKRGRSLIDRVADANATLPISARPSVTFSKTMSLTSDGSSQVSGSATFKTNASVGISIENFALKKKIKWAFWDSEVWGSFEVRLWAEAFADLDISGTYTAETSKQLLKQALPGAGWSVKIPFVGRVGVGAFVKLDFVADIVFEAGATLSASTVLEKREKINFDIIPKFKLSASVLSNTNDGSSGIALKNSFSTSVSASITGFAGLRPAAGLAIDFGSVFNADVNLGLKVGVQASLTAKYPPFEPVTSGGVKVGVCDNCHTVQGVLSLKGKDLALEYSSGSKGDDFTLLEDVFEIPFGTYCAVKQTCLNTDIYGSVEGTYFEDNPKNKYVVWTFTAHFKGVKDITFWHGSSINGYKITWRYSSGVTQSKSRGSKDGTASVIELPNGEHIMLISAYYDSNSVNALSFMTSAGRTFGWFGSKTGTKTTFAATSFHSFGIIGFSGRLDGSITALGTVYR